MWSVKTPIQNLDYPALRTSWLVNSCYHGHRNVYLLRMRRRPHALLFITCTAVYQFKWVDQGVVNSFGPFFVVAFVRFMVCVLFYGVCVMVSVLGTKKHAIISVSQHGVRFHSAATTSTRGIVLAALPFDERAPRKHCTADRSRLKEMVLHVHLSQPIVVL